MECYGKNYGQIGECAKCRLHRYCKTAADPKLLSDCRTEDQELRDIIMNRRLAERRVVRSVAAEEEKRYSRADMMEVIGFMAALDFRSLQLVWLKLNLPNANLSELAEKRGVSRLAMHKMVQRRIKEIPELEKFFTYHRRKRAERKAKTA